MSRIYVAGDSTAPPKMTLSASYRAVCALRMPAPPKTPRTRVTMVTPKPETF
jgi:hypothetical protein